MGKNLVHRAGDILGVVPDFGNITLNALRLFRRYCHQPVPRLLHGKFFRKPGDGFPHATAALHGMILHVEHAENRNRPQREKRNESRKKQKKSVILLWQNLI